MQTIGDMIKYIMFKKLLAVVFVIVLFVIVNNIFRFSTNIAQTTPAPSTANTNLPLGIGFNVNNKTYNFLYFYADPDLLKLVPNFSEKLTSIEIMGQNRCINGINAGFYTTDRKPVGLFETVDEKLANAKNSSLFDVNLVKFGDQLLFNRLNQPIEGVSADGFAIQIGPRLFQNFNPVSLTIRNDEYARRMVVAKTSDEKVLFLAIYDPSTSYQGPLLADLPHALGSIEKLLNITISDAANLDGGSASAFYSDTASLNEVSLVGSFFCVTQ